MIELNSKTRQDFLDREWVQKLLDAGVDMSDAKYAIQKLDNKDKIVYIGTFKSTLKEAGLIPTYTVSELLYKLHEWIYPTIDGIEYSGGLTFIKDAPFYIFWYDLGRNKKRQTVDGEETVRVKGPEDYIYAEFEYPIESLASLLIQCHKKDIGIKDKKGNQVSDTGNISDK
jgi:hypothetical protein